jgi:hypothetical protein
MPRTIVVRGIVAYLLSQCFRTAIRPARLSGKLWRMRGRTALRKVQAGGGEGSCWPMVLPGRRTG